MLCELALVVGRTLSLLLLDHTFDSAKTSPETNPTKMAEQLASVTGALKNTSPEIAIGSLFNAPTMEYVVEDVTRTHHALV